MSQPALRDLLNVATEAAYLAGRRTLAYFNAGVDVEDKPDQSPVTVADREAEDVCRATISRWFPDHTITGEERADRRGNDDYTWIIDPIDGTKSFIHGVPLYGVLIGCLVRGTPSVGVIYLPALDEMIDAAEGMGCRWNGRTARCSDVRRIEDATILAGSITRAMERSDAFADLASRCKLNRGWGDAFGYALVATGRADLMLDPRILPWDCAPMPVIMREAGGWSGNWNGQQDIHGDDWLAVAPGIREEVLATLQKHPTRPTWPSRAAPADATGAQPTPA